MQATLDALAQDIHERPEVLRLIDAGLAEHVRSLVAGVDGAPQRAAPDDPARHQPEFKSSDVEIEESQGLDAEAESHYLTAKEITDAASLRPICFATRPNAASSACRT